MTDFRSALISLAHAHALYSGDMSLLLQRWEDIKKHSFVYFFDESVGAVNKPIAFMGSGNCKVTIDIIAHLSLLCVSLAAALR